MMQNGLWWLITIHWNWKDPVKTNYLRNLLRPIHWQYSDKQNFTHYYSHNFTSNQRTPNKHTIPLHIYAKRVLPLPRPCSGIGGRGEPLKEAATYSPALRCSTIGAGGLNFSVRDGKRWNPAAIAAWYSLFRTWSPLYTDDLNIRHRNKTKEWTSIRQDWQKPTGN